MCILIGRRSGYVCVGVLLIVGRKENLINHVIDPYPEDQEEEQGENAEKKEYGGFGLLIFRIEKFTLQNMEYHHIAGIKAHLLRLLSWFTYFRAKEYYTDCGRTRKNKTKACNV